MFVRITVHSVAWFVRDCVALEFAHYIYVCLIFMCTNIHPHTHIHIYLTDPPTCLERRAAAAQELPPEDHLADAGVHGQEGQPRPQLRELLCWGLGRVDMWTCKGW